MKDWCKDIRYPREGKTVYVGTSWKDVSYQDSENKPKTVGIRIKRRRLRTVISNLILVASHEVERGGNLVLSLGQSNTQVVPL